MEQQIRFCTTSEGARIAYATVGEGPPLVWVPGWVSHLELDWEIPAMRTFYETLAHHHTLVRYDERGGCAPKGDPFRSGHPPGDGKAERQNKRL